ncbi:MAG: PAS domain S-box protein, partial [Rhodomicrobium sp.]
MLVGLRGKASLDEGWLGKLRQRTPAGAALAAASGLIYFFAAWFTLPFTTPEGVAEFWPAAGIAVGALIVLGRAARLPVAAGVAGASFLANWLFGRTVPACFGFALGNAGVALLVAALIERWFAQPFELDRLKSVLGLVAAAAIGAAAWEAVTAVILELAGHTEAPLTLLWSRLGWANVTGIVIVAPLLLALMPAVRKPPPRAILIEGSAVLILHALASAHAFGLLPFAFGGWMLVAPLSTQMPLLLWLSVRCGPLFAAAGSLVLGLSIFVSFIIERGRFADAAFPLDERLFAMHFAMLATTLIALAVAALIAERRNAELAARQSEARLRLSIKAGKIGTWDFDPYTGLFSASPTAARCFGLPSGSPLPLSAVTGALHPSDREAWQAQLKRVAGEGGGFESEYRALWADGSVRWLRLMAAGDGDGVSGSRQVAGAVRDVTGQKSIESLKESVEQWRLFVEQAPAALAMFDRQMRYLAASQRWIKNYELGDRNLIGRSHYEVFPDLPERWRQVHKRALAGEVVSAGQDPFVRAGGQTKWLRWEVRPWRAADGSIGGIVIFSEDITASLEAERALRESEERLRAIVGTAVDAIVVIDEAGEVQSINAAGERIFGYTPGEIVGKNISILMPEPHRSDHDGYLEAYRRTGNAKIVGIGREVECRRKDGSVFAGDLAVAEWRVADKRYFTGTIRDITERKRHEEQVDLLMHEVNHRAKNMLAVVLAVARQTLATKP